MFIAGEAGPELVTSWGGDSSVLNAEQLLSAITEGMAMASQGDRVINVWLDGGIIDRQIITAEQRMNTRSGGR